MTEQQHPITPPPELVQQWINEGPPLYQPKFAAHFIATQAARWGADQELEACVEWLTLRGNPRCAVALQEARRPKAPSLAEQALAQCNDYIDPEGVIRAALERLQELEKSNE